MTGSARKLKYHNLPFNISMTFSRLFFAGLLQLAFALTLARYLGPDGVGTYAVAMLTPTLMAQVLNLGIASANVYFIASKTITLSEAWPISRDFSIILSVVGLLSGFSLTIFAGDTIFPKIPSEILLLALLTLPLSLLNTISIGLFQAVSDFRSFNIATLSQPTFSLAAIFLLHYIHALTIYNLLLSLIAAYALTLCFTLLLLSKHTSLLKRSSLNRNYLKKALKFGTKAHAGNIISFLNYRIDLLLVNYLIGPSSAGIYSITVRLAEQLWLISQAVSIVIFPKLSSLSDKEKATSAITPFVSRLTLWTTLAASCVLAIFAEPIIDLLFGKKFAESSASLLVLLPGIVLFSSSRVIANDFAARGMVGKNLHIALIVLTVNVIANMLLVPQLGIAGAALATSIAYASSLLIRVFILQHKDPELDWKSFILLSRKDARYLRKLVCDFTLGRPSKPQKHRTTNLPK